VSEAKKPATDSTAKRIDVTSNDEPASDGVAKAVVITSRPILKALSEATPAEAQSAPNVQTAPPLPAATEAKKATNKSVLKPLALSTEKASATEPDKSDQQTAESVATPTVDATPAAMPTPTKTVAAPVPTGQTTNGVKNSDDSASDDVETKDATQTEQELNAETEAQAKHDEAIQKLIDAKQYFLPINAVELRKTKHFVVLGVIFSLLLLVAWADIALDAGLVQIPGIKPVTHFFSN